MAYGLDHLVQALLVIAIFALGWLRTRVLAGAGFALDRLRPLRRQVTRDAWLDTLAAHGEESAIAEVARAAGDGDEIELEVAIREQRARLGRGLRALRVLGAASTALGFCGALFHVAWMSESHGLLDLDPSRVARIGTSAAALSVALGVGGSALALSTLVALQARARALTADVDTFVRGIEP